MPTHESAVQRGTHRGRDLLRRLGEELRVGRVAAGLSSRTLGRMIGISHTQVIRIERGLAPLVDIDVVCRMASVLGYWLTLGLYPIASPVRDAGHLALLARLRQRVHPDLGVRRVILLVLDSSHNREVVRSTPWLAERFPVGTRAAVAALASDRDPGGDCLIFL